MARLRLELQEIFDEPSPTQRRQKVQELFPVLLERRANGHTYEQLAEFLKEEHGVTISSSTLRDQLTRFAAEAEGDEERARVIVRQGPPRRRQMTANDDGSTAPEGSSGRNLYTIQQQLQTTELAEAAGQLVIRGIYELSIQAAPGLSREALALYTPACKVIAAAIMMNGAMWLLMQGDVGRSAVAQQALQGWSQVAHSFMDKAQKAGGRLAPTTRGAIWEAAIQYTAASLLKLATKTRLSAQAKERINKLANGEETFRPEKANILIVS